MIIIKKKKNPRILQLLCRQCLLTFRRVTGLSWEEVCSGCWKVAHSQYTILRRGKPTPGKGRAFQGGRLQGLREFPATMTMPLPWDGLVGRGCLSPASPRSWPGFRCSCHYEIQFAQGAEDGMTRPGSTGELPGGPQPRGALFPSHWGVLTRKS